MPNPASRASLFLSGTENDGLDANVGHFRAFSPSYIPPVPLSRRGEVNLTNMLNDSIELSDTLNS